MCSAATLVLRAQVLQTLSDFPGSFSNFRFTSIADTDSISNAFASSRIKEERGFQSNILVLPRWQNITYKYGSDHSILWRNFYPRLALLVFGSETSRICSNFAKQSENNWSPFWYFFAVLIISLLHVSLTAVFIHHSHFRLSTFSYPLFTNYAYRLHNYKQKFLP